MARPREFDNQEVLNQVADVFTANGYNGTSMSMLTQATGMGKQSLYNAFGGKEALYLQAVDSSVSRFSESLECMAQTPTGRSAVEVFFSMLMDVCTSANPAENSCILCFGLLEGIQGDLIHAKLKATWQSNHRFICSLVERGQADGSIRSDMQSGDITNLLMTLISGLRVSARAIERKSQIKKIVHHCLEILNPR